MAPDVDHSKRWKTRTVLDCKAPVFNETFMLWVIFVLFDCSQFSVIPFFGFYKMKHAVSRHLIDGSVMLNILWLLLMTGSISSSVFLAFRPDSEFRSESAGCLLFSWIGRISFKSSEGKAIVFWTKLDIDGWAFEMLILCSRDVDEEDEKKRLVVTLWNRNRTSRLYVLILVCF